MKISTLLAVPLIAASAAALEDEKRLEKRQATGGYITTLNMAAPLLGMFGSTPRLAGIDQLKPEVRPDAKHTLSKFGPVTLAGNNNGKEQHHFWSIKQGICHNCSILKGKVGVQFVNGSHADVSTGIFMHHVLSWDVDKKPASFITNCKSSSGYQSGQSAKFLGTGDDQAGVDVWYTDKTGTAGAFHVGANDRFGFWIDLVNYNRETVQVYLTIELEYLEGIQLADARDALLSYEACDSLSQIKTNRAGPATTHAGDWTFLEDGTIVYSKGHLHNGGDRMIMYINGKQVCQSVASYGGNTFHSHGGGQDVDSISGMSTCGNIKVKRGDKLSMDAIYNVAEHPVRKESGLMGIVGLMGMFTTTFIADR